MNNSHKVMKNLYKALIMIISVAFITFACEDSEDETPSPSTPSGLTISESNRQHSFALEGGSKTVIVIAGDTYTATVESGKEWCTVSGVSSTGFKINVAKNGGIDGRTANITVSMTGYESIVVSVTQIGTDPALIIDSLDRDIVFPGAGEDLLVAVTANGAYTAVVESGKDWVTVSDITAENFKITAAQTLNEVRTAKITVSLTGAKSVEIAVTQVPWIIFGYPTETEFTVPVSSSKLGSSYTAEIAYTIPPEEPWLSTVIGSSALTIKFPEYSGVDRTAIITLRSGKVALDIPVTQTSWMNKSLMQAAYVGDDNRTLWGTQPLTMAFDNVSPPHGGTAGNIFCTAPNTDGTTDEPPAEGSTAWTFPFYFTMDLGAEIYLNKFKITPRCNNNSRMWEFRLGSPYKYEIYGTNEDKSEIPEDDPYWNGAWIDDWEYLGSFTNHNGSGLTPETITAASDISEEDAIEAGNGYIHNLLPTKKPVRYLRFKINEVWEKGVTYVHFQELWFWGQKVE
jgi:hypothetical protein